MSRNGEHIERVLTYLIYTHFNDYLDLLLVMGLN